MLSAKEIIFECEQAFFGLPVPGQTSASVSGQLHAAHLAQHPAIEFPPAYPPLLLRHYHAPQAGGADYFVELNTGMRKNFYRWHGSTMGTSYDIGPGATKNSPSPRVNLKIPIALCPRLTNHVLVILLDLQETWT